MSDPGVVLSKVKTSRRAWSTGWRSRNPTANSLDKVHLVAHSGLGRPWTVRSNRSWGRSHETKAPFWSPDLLPTRSHCLGRTEANTKAWVFEINQHGDRRQDSQSAFLTQGSEQNERNYKNFKLGSWLSPISPYKPLVLLEAMFSLLKEKFPSLCKGLWGRHFSSLISADWRFLVLGSSWRHRFPSCKHAMLFCKMTPGFLTQQPALRKQTWFKQINILGDVSFLFLYLSLAPSCFVMSHKMTSKRSKVFKKAKIFAHVLPIYWLPV